MTTLSQDIRAALHALAITASGFPTSIAEEGMPYTPTAGTTWAAFSFRPASQRPISVSGSDIRSRGVYQVSIYCPAGNGTGAADAIADAVRAVFVPGSPTGSRIQLDGLSYIAIEYAERAAPIIDAEWINVPVRIGWVCYSTNR